MRQRIVSIQTSFYTTQERAQVALANALALTIKEQKDLGNDTTAQEQTYQRSEHALEYYSQAENSMGFHKQPRGNHRGDQRSRLGRFDRALAC